MYDTNKYQSDYVFPKLRTDLNLQHLEQDDQDYIVLSDTTGFTEQPVAITTQFLYLLNLIDGKITIDGINDLFEKEQGQDVNIDPILEQIVKLEQLGFLETEEFLSYRDKKIKDYLDSPTRPATCAGGSYSENKDDLRLELEDIFNSVDVELIKPGAKAIIVPHIDFRIGHISHETYASGYHALRDTNADLFVIFGTSHFANSDYFMLTKKDYETPLGKVETDSQLIDQLSQKLPNDLKIDDLAHQNEHSIELQIVLLQKYFEGRKFTILPVLVGSFYDFILKEEMPWANAKVQNFVEILNKTINEMNKKPAYIASVDFGHIGRKFGDDFDAADKLDDLREADDNLIKCLTNGKADDFFDQISKVQDKWKVCGTSPIYTLIKSIGPKNGNFLKYNQWNELEMKSAVSFASIAYYD